MSLHDSMLPASILAALQLELIRQRQSDVAQWHIYKQTRTDHNNRAAAAAADADDAPPKIFASMVDRPWLKPHPLLRPGVAALAMQKRAAAIRDRSGSAGPTATARVRSFEEVASIAAQTEYLAPNLVSDSFPPNPASESSLGVAADEPSIATPPLYTLCLVHIALRIEMPCIREAIRAQLPEVTAMDLLSAGQIIAAQRTTQRAQHPSQRAKTFYRLAPTKSASESRSMVQLFASIYPSSVTSLRARIAHPSELKMFKWMISLDLTDCKLGDESMMVLGRDFARLETLALPGNQLTDGGVALLVRSTRLQQGRKSGIEGLDALRWLDLSRNSITPAACQHLLVLSSLERVGLSDTKCTNATLPPMPGLLQADARSMHVIAGDGIFPLCILNSGWAISEVPERASPVEGATLSRPAISLELVLSRKPASTAPAAPTSKLVSSSSTLRQRATTTPSAVSATDLLASFAATGGSKRTPDAPDPDCNVSRPSRVNPFAQIKPSQR
ncbi:hypothetical protein CAOG_04969 [Capsaspora owczarzaki ATCC 30864]|uniref:Uncharacterized protein n=1 Tax=Capsaspora owczarzaki (strain ATCC 30864) TaxID=595528 RepID=A0A0D2X3H3_CAPO3|nr:hypothetical protein CAOG_04969 [Capsaspora owczarzaki ATCC 30864]KJE94309.1 hypothetical protein CAOG_004969 [Capsaspora owczarzaki ATCC 30864]|eukprot:XP_004346654.1 hypothetical protein CAOG_04969 [Capsaspora owczarzaki ATCC 30864]